MAAGAKDGTTADFLYSRGRSKLDAYPEQLAAEDFEQFVQAVLGDPRPHVKGRTYVCGPFRANGDGRHHRCMADALPRRFLAFDVDGMPDAESFAALIGWLQPLSGFAYTTASHTPDKPRARFILEASREVDRAEGERVCLAIEARIDGALGAGRYKWDPSVHRAEQPCFTPLVGAEVYQFEGEPVDVDALLAEVPASGEVPGPGQGDGAGPPLHVDAGTVRDLRSALAFIPSDDRDLWVRMGHALKEMGNVGRGLWTEWSQNSLEDKFDPKDTTRVWRSLSPTQTGYQAVFAEAQRRGWVNPLSGPAAGKSPGEQPARLTAGESEELVSWCWRSGTKLPTQGVEWPRVSLGIGRYSAPWPSLGAQGRPEQFIEQVEKYLPRRAELVERENLKRAKPEPDMPEEELLAHAERWLARVRGLDVPDERGRELLVRVSADAQVFRPLRLVPVRELLETPELLRWLVKRYLPPACVALLFGDPSAGKSLLAIDWAASIATGREWSGCRTAAGTVIYLAGEGHFGIRRRLLAWALHHGCLDALREAPLYVSDVGAALIDSASVEVLVQSIDAIVLEAGPAVLIVIDTLHRNFGPGDENSAQDIGLFIAAADRLRSRYAATVLVVHHSGHGDKDRSRGSSAIRGSVDVELMMAKDGDMRTLSCPHKMKDAPRPQPMVLDLETVTLPWVDEDGDAETSVVLVPGQSGAVKRRALPGGLKLAFDALLTALGQGFAPPEHWPGVAPARVVPLEAWRKSFYTHHTGDSQDGKKHAFRRARQELVEAQAVSVRDDCYWPTPENGPWAELVGSTAAANIVANGTRDTPGQTGTNVPVEEPWDRDKRDTPL